MLIACERLAHMCACACVVCGAHSVEVLVTDFLKWYQSFISFALYPSGSYQRKSTAVALYRELLNVFGAGSFHAPPSTRRRKAHAPHSRVRLTLCVRCVRCDEQTRRATTASCRRGMPTRL